MHRKLLFELNDSDSSDFVDETEANDTAAGPAFGPAAETKAETSNIVEIDISDEDSDESENSNSLFPSM